MILEKIRLVNYRNIKSCELNADSELNVISGKNGQGKTNLLEAVWLLSGGKSFRGAKDNELINKSAEFSKIFADTASQAKKRNIEITIGSKQSGHQGRYASVNDVPYGRATNLAGTFNCVVFAPNHLSLLKGSPDGRRKFIDAALCQLYPSYIEALKRYSRILTQKNALLKDNKKTSTFYDMLDVFDDEIADLSFSISKKREQYLNALFPFAKATYDNISNNSEELHIKYKPTASSGEEMKAIIKNSRQKDIYAGFCTQGAHREDFDILLNGDDAKVFASQGQQRSIVLSLKLSEANEIFEVTQNKPVMLLDDVLSELDASRQDFLLNKITGRQVFITSCESDAFVKTKGSIFIMENGELRKGQ